MHLTNINNLKIDKTLFDQILKAIKFISKYRSHYHFRRLGFERIYPKIASGRYFFIHKELGLFVKCSFTVDIPKELPKNTQKLIIPTVLLEFDEYEVSSSQWLIQPIADTKYQIKTFRELKENKDYRFFCDGCKYNVGRLNGKAVVIDW